MAVSARFLTVICSAVLIISLGAPASAQLEEQLSAYTGRNSRGYLRPLIDAFGADLNAGLFHSGQVPRWGLHYSVEFRAMSVFFGDDDRTFVATTEEGFIPEQSVEAPTVVGPIQAVIVDGAEGTRFAFPGGFDVSSLSFVVPQMRVGSIYGTEALVRYLLYYTGNANLGDLKLYGIGIRHSISQHIPFSFPVAMAVGLFWQRISIGKNKRGDELISAHATSFGLHASKRLAKFEPYVGLAYDTFSMDVTYVEDSSLSSDSIELALESDAVLHLTLGLSLSVAFMNIHGEYNIARQDALSVGLAFGNYDFKERSVRR